MPITKLTIENFKGIADRVEIPLRPITLLFGANSAGKSTILQALFYLRELLARQNADADRLISGGDAIDLGGFRQFVHRHDLNRPIGIGITIQLDADGLPSYRVPPLQTGDSETDGCMPEDLSATTEIDLELVVVWNEQTQRPWIKHYIVGSGGEPFTAITAEPGFRAAIEYASAEHPLLRGEGSGEADDLNPFVSAFIHMFTVTRLLADRSTHPGGQAALLGDRVVPQFGRALSIEWAASLDDQEDGLSALQVEHTLSQILVGAGEIALKELDAIRYIGSLRAIPERHFHPRRSPADDRWANGTAAWDLLYSNDLEWFDEGEFESLGLGYRIERRSHFEIPTESAIAAFLVRYRMENEIFPDEAESLNIQREVENLEEKHSLGIVDVNRDVEVDPCDVGVGVSQVIPVVVGAMAPGYSILSVEQPELHIHPAVQCALADVLARQVIGATERCLLLETHSEHLMLRLLRRIREGHEGELPPGAPAIKPEDLAVLYVENTEHGQKITELPVTGDGDFARKWPKGFFEERAGELF